MPRAAAHPTSLRKRRHKLAAGYPRGDETRAKIVAAALDVFGSHGFGGASTRMLADRADVSLPALQYYFDGKEGVYLACAEHIAEGLEERLGPMVERVAEAITQEPPSRQRLHRLLDEFLDHFADLFLGAHELEKWVLFIIREQAQPTPAFDGIYERVMSPVARCCMALVARLVDLPQDDARVRLHTIAFLGRIIFFRTGREAVLRLLDWPDFEGERLSLMKTSLRAQTTAALAELRRAARSKP